MTHHLHDKKPKTFNWQDVPRTLNREKLKKQGGGFIKLNKIYPIWLEYDRENSH